MTDDVPGSPGAVPTTPPPRRPTVVQQVSFVCFATAAVSVLVFLEAGSVPPARTHTPASCAASLLAGCAHAMWISLDRRRQGLEPGWWRFGAFFAGPLVIWTHLVVQYRARALWMIPLSLVPYGVCYATAIYAFALATRS